MCTQRCIDCFLEQQKSVLHKKNFENIEKVLNHWKCHKREHHCVCTASAPEVEFSLTEQELYLILFYFSGLGDCQMQCCTTGP